MFNLVQLHIFGVRFPFSGDCIFEPFLGDVLDYLRLYHTSSLSRSPRSEEVNSLRFCP